jgi:hypothetical protein
MVRITGGRSEMCTKSPENPIMGWRMAVPIGCAKRGHRNDSRNEEACRSTFRTALHPVNRDHSRESIELSSVRSVRAPCRGMMLTLNSHIERIRIRLNNREVARVWMEWVENVIGRLRQSRSALLTKQRFLFRSHFSPNSRVISGFVTQFDCSDSSRIEGQSGPSTRSKV